MKYVRNLMNFCDRQMVVEPNVDLEKSFLSNRKWRTLFNLSHQFSISVRWRKSHVTERKIFWDLFLLALVAFRFSRHSRAIKELRISLLDSSYDISSGKRSLIIIYNVYLGKSICECHVEDWRTGWIGFYSWSEVFSINSMLIWIPQFVTENIHHLLLIDMWQYEFTVHGFIPTSIA